MLSLRKGDLAMSEAYSQAAATDHLHCTWGEYKRLRDILADSDDEAAENPNKDMHNYVVQWQLPYLTPVPGDAELPDSARGEVLIYAEDSYTEGLPKEFLKLVSEILYRRGEAFLEIGVGCGADSINANDCGGHYFRITSDGELEHAKYVWPREAQALFEAAAPFEELEAFFGRMTLAAGIGTLRDESIFFLHLRHRR